MLWAYLDETREGRTQAWKHLVLSGERFKKPEFAYFRALAVEAFELFETSGLAENAVALRRSVLARIEKMDPKSDLARQIRAGHAFKVTTSWANLLMDALVRFAEVAGNAGNGGTADPSAPDSSSTSATEVPSTFTSFFERHLRSLPVLCKRLLDARRELLRWDDGEANDFRTFLTHIDLVPTTPDRDAREATCAVLRALLRRHMRQKGMHATVRCDDDGEQLVMSGPKPTYVGASDEVLKRLDAEGADVEALTELSPLNQPLSNSKVQIETEADWLLKRFIGINGTWRIFANWFALAKTDTSADRLEAWEEDELQ